MFEVGIVSEGDGNGKDEYGDTRRSTGGARDNAGYLYSKKVNMYVRNMRICCRST